MELTQNFVNHAILEAKEAAYAAADDFFRQRLNGVDQYACGFAWVTVYEKGSTKLGRALIEAGFRKAYGGGLQLWNPSGMMVQNVDTLEAGAEAAAEFLTETLGVKFYAGSRLD